MTNHFEQNRPVHLARRDVFYEHVVDMLSEPYEGASAIDRVDDYEKILFLLRTSRRHARFSVRSRGINPKDREFCKYIELLVGSVKAVLAMLRQKHSVEHAEGFFFSFLGVNHASVILQAEEYERRANDILRSLLNTIQLAEEPFLTLREMNRADANKGERIRYKKARAHFTTLLEQYRDLSADDSSAGLLLVD